MAAVTKRVRFHGRVQGVNFRRRTRDAAMIFEVAGWVRNMPDGSVEAEFSGEPSKVEAIISYCRDRMPSARVDRIEQETVEYSDYSDFEIRY